MKADSAFQNTLFQKFNSNYYYYLSSLDKNLVDNVVYRHSLQGAFKIYVKDGQQIEKGQPIYSWYAYENGCNTHPHNFYIQFLAELGVIGFLFFEGEDRVLVFKDCAFTFIAMLEANDVAKNKVKYFLRKST